MFTPAGERTATLMAVKFIASLRVLIFNIEYTKRKGDRSILPVYMCMMIFVLQHDFGTEKSVPQKAFGFHTCIQFSYRSDFEQSKFIARE